MIGYLLLAKMARRMELLNAAHHLCQRLVHWMRRINSATMIVEFLKALFPLLPFFPRGDLKIGYFAFTPLQAAFLYLRGALTVDDQHRGVKLPCDLLAAFVCLPVRERGVYYNAQA